MSVLGDINAVFAMTADPDARDRVKNQLSDPKSPLSLALDVSRTRSEALTGWPNAIDGTAEDQDAIQAKWAALSKQYRGWRLAWRWLPHAITQVVFCIALPRSVAIAVTVMSGSAVIGVTAAFVTVFLLARLMIYRWQSRRMPHGTAIECAFGAMMGFGIGLWICDVGSLVFDPLVDTDAIGPLPLMLGYLGALLGCDYGFGVRERLVLGGLSVRVFVATMIAIPITWLPFGAIALAVIVWVFNIGPAISVAFLIMLFIYACAFLEAIIGHDLPRATSRELLIAICFGLIQGAPFTAFFVRFAWIDPSEGWGHPIWWFITFLWALVPGSVSLCYYHGFKACVQSERDKIRWFGSLCVGAPTGILLLEVAHQLAKKFLARGLDDLFGLYLLNRQLHDLANLLLMGAAVGVSWFVTYRWIFPWIAAVTGLTRLLDRWSIEDHSVSPREQVRSRLWLMLTKPVSLCGLVASELLFSVKECYWDVVSHRSRGTLDSPL